MSKLDCIVLLSGGLDSATLLADLTAKGYKPWSLFVDYGQRMANTEGRAARAISSFFGARFDAIRVPLPTILAQGWLMCKPEKLEWTTNSVSFLPQRNLFLLTLAAMLAQKHNIQQVFIGLIDTGPNPFPDSTPYFIELAQSVLALCYPPINIHAPYLGWNKTEVVRRAVQLNVPISHTFSCEFAIDHHCGGCPSCVDRFSALETLETEKRQ